jgi:hypothetical protein
MRHGDLARVFASFCKKKRFLFFFEKKNQKTPVHDPVRTIVDADAHRGAT